MLPCLLGAHGTRPRALLARGVPRGHHREQAGAARKCLDRDRAVRKFRCGHYAAWGARQCPTGAVGVGRERGRAPLPQCRGPATPRYPRRARSLRVLIRRGFVFERPVMTWAESRWIEADRLHPLIPRETGRSTALHRRRAAVERGSDAFKNEWGLTPLGVRNVERVRLHADLTILATLA